jgi:hypothetical protein
VANSFIFVLAWYFGTQPTVIPTQGPFHSYANATKEVCILLLRNEILYHHPARWLSAVDAFHQAAVNEQTNPAIASTQWASAQHTTAQTPERKQLLAREDFYF